MGTENKGFLNSVSLCTQAHPNRNCDNRHTHHGVGGFQNIAKSRLSPRFAIEPANATRGNFDEIFNFDFAAAFILVDGEHQMECVYESGQRQRFLFVEKMQFKIFTA